MKKAEPLGRRYIKIQRELDKFATKDIMTPKWQTLYDESNQIDRIIADRNVEGQELEKQGDIEAAIKLYEQNVKDEVVAIHPYERLAIIYRKQNRLNDEIRVLKETIRILGHSEKWDNQLIKALQKQKGK